MSYVPSLPGAGVPAIVAVPLLFAVKVTPAGNEPDSLRVGAGKPVLFTLKEKAAPMVAWADAAEVIAGGWSTVKVKDCVVVPALPFAFKVRV